MLYWLNKHCSAAVSTAALLLPHLRCLIDATHPSSLWQKYLLPRPLWKGEISQNALKGSFGDSNSQEVWEQSCTSVVVLACFLAAVPARLWTQMEIHLLPVPSWLVPFLFPSTTSSPCSQEPVCQQKPCTSPCAYQTVYPFPVGAILHLWRWQPIATLRVHSKPWFRCPALPALLHQPPLPPISCEVFTPKALAHYIQPFPRAHKVEHIHQTTIRLLCSPIDSRRRRVNNILHLTGKVKTLH